MRSAAWLAGLLMTVAAGAGAAAELVPHRAIYGISLVAASPGSGIVGARGRMLYRFEKVCDGWTVENRSALRFQYGEDEEAVESRWTYTSWESDDGKWFRYGVRHARNGTEVERIDGRASLERPGGPGKADYTAPSPKTAALPAGTLFPTEHVRVLLEAARSGGGPVVRRVVFDGSSLDNPYAINAVVFEAAPYAGAAKLLEPFGAQPTRGFRFALFAAESASPAPEYEITIHYRDDGITDWLRQDLPELSLEMRLEAIERMPAPDC